MTTTPCQSDPELWFADAAALQREAKRACAGCDMRQPCLEASRYVKHGIWGGLDEKERDAFFGRSRIPVQIARDEL